MDATPEERAELRALLADLARLAGERFRIDQGLLAAIFVADALKAGGYPKDDLRLGILRLPLIRERAPAALAARWDTLIGEVPALSHNVLLIAGFVVDPILPLLREGAEAISELGQDPYTELESRPIYRG